MKTTIILALGASLLASAAWADSAIYKWVDAQGVVHYSAEPHGDESKTINVVNTGNSLPGASTAAAPVSATAAAAADAALVMPTPADSLACKAGRDRLFRYMHADSLYKIDSDGQKQQLSVQDMQKTLDQAREYVRQVCTPGGG